MNGMFNLLISIGWDSVSPVFRGSLFNLPVPACLLQIQRWCGCEESTALKTALQVPVLPYQVLCRLLGTSQILFCCDANCAGRLRLRKQTSIFPSLSGLCSFCHVEMC